MARLKSRALRVRRPDPARAQAGRSFVRRAGLSDQSGGSCFLPRPLPPEAAAARDARRGMRRKRVTAVGSGVARVSAGDLVINLQRESGRSVESIAETDVLRLPADIDVKQAAMLRINPPTAFLLLSDIVDLKPGDWIIRASPIRQSGVW